MSWSKVERRMSKVGRSLTFDVRPWTFDQQYLFAVGELS